jgi:hypothetical protein
MQQVALYDVIKDKSVPELLVGAHLDFPKSGENIGSFVLELSGWVVGKEAIKHLEIVYDNKVLKTLELFCRQDIIKAFPEAQGSEKAGFRTWLSTACLDSQFELSLRCVFENGKRLRLFKIKGSSAQIETSHDSVLSPIILNSPGRSGTTLVMRLLSFHPEIVCQNVYPYETRAASYWLHAFRVLTEASDYRASYLPGDNFDTHWLGNNPYNDWHFIRPFLKSPGENHFLGQTYVNQTADHMKRMIDEFYIWLASTQHKNPKYFLEKYPPSYDDIIRIARRLYTQTKEIFLIRDPRDILCSITAFNSKRKTLSFGRQQEETEQEYINKLNCSFQNFHAITQSRKSGSSLVRYEDLVMKPQETIGKLLDFLTLSNDSATIRSILEQSDVEVPQLKFHKTSESAAASIGRWQQDLNEDMQAYCNDIFRDILLKFGYE